MALASFLISVVSLLASITVAWLTLFRRGTLRMTHPRFLSFLYEGDQPKVFLRAMLYATGKHGHVIEALYLKVRRGEVVHTFDFWSYGESNPLMIGSGLRVGEDGVSFNHHFLPPKDAVSFAFVAGEYAVDVYARTVNRRQPISLCSVTLLLSQPQAEAVQQRRRFAAFTWDPESNSYRCEISEDPVPLPPFHL